MIDMLIKCPMEKSVVNTNLVLGPTPNNRKAKNHPHSSRPRHMAKSIVIVNAWMLMKIFGNKANALTR